jgi:molecular chaperone GrpE
MSEKEQAKEKIEEQAFNQEEQAGEAAEEQEQETTDEAPEADKKAKGQQFGAAETDDRIVILEQELLEEKNKYLRLYAEFENFRKRTAKERLELIGSATADLMKEILPVVDDFERAIQSNEQVDDINAVKEGFSLLHNKMVRLLGNKGLKAIESKGETFDAEMHEAIAQVPAEKKSDKGKVIDEVEKGYKLNDKIIRHPKVVVGT